MMQSTMDQPTTLPDDNDNVTKTTGEAAAVGTIPMDTIVTAQEEQQIPSSCAIRTNIDSSSTICMTTETQIPDQRVRSEQPPRQQHVRVGVGVVIVSPGRTTTLTDVTDGNRPRLHNNRIWVGRRRGSHGANTLALPGGHLEMYESWSDCAIREVQEEMGITLSQVELLHVTNDIMFNEQKHYITIFMIGRYDPDALGSPINCEPNKCDGWELYTLQQLQDLVTRDDKWGTKDEETLFKPLKHLIQDNPPALTKYCL